MDTNQTSKTYNTLKILFYIKDVYFWVIDNITSYEINWNKHVLQNIHHKIKWYIEDIQTHVLETFLSNIAKTPGEYQIVGNMP
jgi:endo-beta-N-acetylglucosaminidase D